MSTIQPWFWEFERLVRQVDPDTLVCRLRRKIDVGFDLEADFGVIAPPLRLRGCDLPEKHTTTLAMAHKAMDWMLDVITTSKVTEVQTWKGDKYGRWLADLILDPHGSLVELAIRDGYAQAYNGQGPRPTWDPALPYPLVQS